MKKIDERTNKAKAICPISFVEVVGSGVHNNVYPCKPHISLNKEGFKGDMDLLT